MKFVSDTVIVSILFLKKLRKCSVGAALQKNNIPEEQSEERLEEEGMVF